MRSVYIAIEKSVERFEKYKALWATRGKDGIWANTMTDGIKTAINVEKWKTDELFFISIVASEMPNFMQELSILSAVTTAPILIATENYIEKEHREALRNGADYYGLFCETTEDNIDAVMSSIESIERRKLKKELSGTVIHGGLMISLAQRRTFFNDVYIDLTCQEFDILYYFMSNIGTALSYEQIYSRVWGDWYNDSSVTLIKGAIRRVRKKIAGDENNNKIIENVRGFGYRMPF